MTHISWKKYIVNWTRVSLKSLDACMLWKPLRHCFQVAQTTSRRAIVQGTSCGFLRASEASASTAISRNCDNRGALRWNAEWCCAISQPAAFSHARAHAVQQCDLLLPSQSCRRVYSNNDTATYCIVAQCNRGLSSCRWANTNNSLTHVRFSYFSCRRL